MSTNGGTEGGHTATLDVPGYIQSDQQKKPSQRIISSDKLTSSWCTVTQLVP